MLTYSKWLALAAGAALTAGSIFAQDNKALIDTLIKKGVLTNEEAAQIQAEAAAAAKPVPTAKPESASKTIISGKLFIDLTNVDAQNASGAKLSSSGTGADVKRFYIGVTHQFNDIWSANITTDAGFSSATGTTALFIKTAYLQAKLSPAAIIQLGSAGQPWIPFAEDMYGFRYVENTLVDRLKYGNSADWGAHFLGKQGIFSYSFAAVNGGGYKNPTRSKGMDYEGRVGIEPVKGLTFAVGGYTGKLGKDVYGSPANRTATRYDVLAAYKTAKFRVGTEYYWESDWGFTNNVLSDKGDGYAVWGDVALSGPFSLFARYDDAKTSKKLHPNLEDTYYNIGVQYHAFAGIDLSLVYKHEDVKNPASASALKKSDEFGLFSQVAF